MNLVFLRLAALAIFINCFVQQVHATSTNAVIPYKSLDDLSQFIEEVDQARLEVRVFVASSNKAVRPSDISLVINSATHGMIPLPLSTNGQLIKFPHEKVLRSENPGIVANQPKGTLSLQITMQIPPPDQPVFRYSRLADGVAEVNKAIKARAGMLSLLAPKAQGVIFFFPKSSAGKARVEVASTTRRADFTADEHGQVKLKLDKSLISENPEVRVSEKPQSIVPNVE